MPNRTNITVCLVVLSLSFSVRPETGQAPVYSAAGIVNAASNGPELAPYTYATVYGTNLSRATTGLSAADFSSGYYPRSLAGVQVLVAGVPAVLTYVSPVQINFLVPAGLRPVSVPVQVAAAGLAGPRVMVALRDTAPALFLLPMTTTAIASRPDYTVATPEYPAHPGDIVILWATGLGPTVPDFSYGEVPGQPAVLANLSQFHVLFDEIELPAERVLYAGIAPGFAGLYQVNVRLPLELGDDPEVRIAADGETSPPGIRIPVRNTGTAAERFRRGPRLTE